MTSEWEIEVDVVPVDLTSAWARGRGGVHGLMDEVLERFGGRYGNDPRNLDFVQTFLVRRRDVDGDPNPEPQRWIEAFEKDKNEAGLSFWHEMRKGIDESLPRSSEAARGRLVVHDRRSSCRRRPAS